MSNTWELQELLRELHRWVGIFVFEFKLEIPDIVLRVDGLRVWRLGHFHRGHNGFGLEGEIAINRRHLNKRDFWDVLGTLLHELLHAWQECHGKPAKGQYHNKQYRRKASEFGLVVDGRGYQRVEPEGAFARLLQAYGVNVPTLPAPSPEPVALCGLKLWVCRCDPPFRMRVARADFRATCNYCGQEYFQSESREYGRR
jgi:hypothetical protein